VKDFHGKKSSASALSNNFPPEIITRLFDQKYALKQLNIHVTRTGAIADGALSLSPAWSSAVST